MGATASKDDGPLETLDADQVRSVGGEGVRMGPGKSRWQGGPGVHRVERRHGRRVWISAGGVVNPRKEIQFKVYHRGYVRGD